MLTMIEIHIQFIKLLIFNMAYPGAGPQESAAAAGAKPHRADLHGRTSGCPS